MPRTELDRQISKALHGTRNKLYRLRKRGANVEQLDPRVPTPELRSMSTREKERYLKRLQKFNLRENKIFIQSNNIAVQYNDLIEYRLAEMNANLDRIALRSSIEQFVEEGQVTRTRWSAYAAMRPDPYTEFGQMYVPAGIKFADIQPIVRTEPFLGQRSLVQASENVRKWAKNRLNVASRYENFKNHIETKLRYWNIEGVDVSSLTMAQMDYLHYYTTFDDTALEIPSPKAIKAGQESVDDSTPEHVDNMSQRLRSLIDMARRRVGAYPDDPGAR